ncbi:MAG: OadG family protein [Thermotogae bacterium]|nr:OadG family protein [Thermotogota bacterium]
MRSFGIFSKEAFETFFQALDVTWKGMVGVFIVMTLLFGAIYLLGKVKNNDQDRSS